MPASRCRCSRSGACSSCACRAANRTRARRCWPSIAAQPPPDAHLPDHHRQARPQSERCPLGAGHREARRMGADLAGRSRRAALLAARARRGAHLEIDPAASQLIVDRVEGNLLAAKQELEILALLANGAPIDAALVMRIGRRQRPLRRLPVGRGGRGRRRGARAAGSRSGCKSEGVEPTLILWALVRELRGLWQARERDRPAPRRAARLEPGGESLAARARAPEETAPRALLLQASQTDRVIKGSCRAIRGPR